jgi:hypothetical protein
LQQQPGAQFQKLMMGLSGSNSGVFGNPDKIILGGLTEENLSHADRNLVNQYLTELLTSRHNQFRLRRIHPS